MKLLTKAEAGAIGGKIGGKSKSAKKAKAVRANGAKGGRPRKITLLLGPGADRVDYVRPHMKAFPTMGPKSRMTGYIVHSPATETQ